MAEANNTLELARGDLTRTLEELFFEVNARPDRAGLPRVHFADAHDKIALRLERTNRGYNVGGTVNGAAALQLNGRFFPVNTHVGTVMLIACSAPTGSTIDGFFS